MRKLAYVGSPVDFQLKRVSQASVIKRERIVKKRLRIKRPKERSRGLGALATELALKAHRAFNLSKLTLRVAFASTMLRSSMSSR